MTAVAPAAGAARRRRAAISAVMPASVAARVQGVVATLLVEGVLYASSTVSLATA
jgi:hypothetical protein